MASETARLTRRVFIGLGALLGGCVLAVFGAVAWLVRRECKINHSVPHNPVPDDHFKRVMSVRIDRPDIYNLDVVTVDSTSASLTWATASESKFMIEGAGGESPARWEERRPARYHAAELTGLKPGTEYTFQLHEAGGGVEADFSFRTLPETGEPLFTFATFSDNHFKPDGVSWPDGRYFRKCSEIHGRLVNDLNRTGADFIINKGDLTDVYVPYRLRAYRNAVRNLEPPTHCIPGNHDHLRNRDFAADWLDFTGTKQVYRSFDHKGFHFILLDTCWTGEQKRGFLGRKQIAWLIDDLEQNAFRRTFIFTHHPVNGDVEEFRMIHDYVEFQKAIAQFPKVTAVFSAHVHRNYVTASPLTPGIPYVETAAVIQYPMGYNVYTVTAAGIKQIFRKLSDVPLSGVPSSGVSLSEESWLASPLRCLTNPGDALGKLSDRNFFVKFKQPFPAG